MFVCETCHDTECAWRLIEPASRGRCEGCGEVRDCVDCHHHKRQPLPKEIHDLIAAKTRVESAPTRIRRSLNADPDALPQCVGDDDFETTPVTVSVPAHLSHTAERRDKVVHIDGCIADLVARLYPLTVSSCCGHGHDAGRIFLA